MQMAYYLTLTTHTQVVSPYVICQLGHNLEK